MNQKIILLKEICISTDPVKLFPFFPPFDIVVSCTLYQLLCQICQSLLHDLVPYQYKNTINLVETNIIIWQCFDI